MFYCYPEVAIHNKKNKKLPSSKNDSAKSNEMSKVEAGLVA